MDGVSFLLMFMMYREGEWRGKECVLRGGNGMDGMELGKGGLDREGRYTPKAGYIFGLA